MREEEHIGGFCELPWEPRRGKGTQSMTTSTAVSQTAAVITEQPDVHTHTHTLILVNDVKTPSSFMHRSKGYPNHLFGCCSFTAPERLLLSPLPLHSFWLADGWKEGGWSVGGWVIMGLCDTQCVHAHSSVCRFGRWDGKRQVRRGRA